MALSHCQASGDRTPVVRTAAVAGQFYPADVRQLDSTISECLAGKSAFDGFSPLVIVPHAGYVFSGAVAGQGYMTIDPHSSTVILIGPSHHKAFRGLALPDADFFETPLGRVPVASGAISKIRENPLVHIDAQAHRPEHSLEVHLPFLQKRLEKFSIVPILCGEVDEAEVARLVETLLDDRTTVVISTDLSHFMNSPRARQVDQRTVAAILDDRVDAAMEACGETPVRIAMHLARLRGWRPVLLDMRNSHETAPQYCNADRVVGYATIAYRPGGELSRGEQVFLLDLARQSLQAAVADRAPPHPDVPPPGVREKRGCFVTLTAGGELRGCIGYLEGIKPLYQAVMDNVANAALNDPRFPPVKSAELAGLRIEISVLSVAQPLSYRDPQDLLTQLVPGRDGLILTCRGRQSTFLPQVWEQLPGKVEFLEHLARKAGLPRDEWKNATYQRYHAVHFQED